MPRSARECRSNSLDHLSVVNARRIREWHYARVSTIRRERHAALLHRKINTMV